MLLREAPGGLHGEEGVGPVLGAWRGFRQVEMSRGVAEVSRGIAEVSRGVAMYGGGGAHAQCGRVGGWARNGKRELGPGLGSLNAKLAILGICKA